MNTHWKSIFILSGAGLSAESGLGTFRDRDGVWARFRPEELATPEAFQRDPARVLEFYDARRRNGLGASPHSGHIALADLQRAWANAGGQVTLCTQNVDGLLEAAGAPEVIHMHGELAKAWCTRCDVRSRWVDDMPLGARCPACDRAGGVRPDIVWFGEMPYHMDLIEERLKAADLFVSIGTSGAVYPAAGFVSAAARLGIPTLEINLEPSEGARRFDQLVLGKASEAVPAWVEGMMAGL
jgi:NAD-dependent deacetylase